MPVYKTKSEKTKDNKIWYFMVSYTDLLGNKKRYKSKKYTTKEEATKEEAKYRINIGTNVIKSYTFNEIFNEYIEKKKSKVRPQTITRNLYLYNYIEKYLGNIKIEKLNLNQYDNFKNELNSTTLSTDYKNRIHKLVITLINYSEMYYNITNKIPQISGGFNNPLEKKKEMQFFTREEFNSFINVIDDIIWKSFFEILFFCGLRQGEAQALTWKDIDFDKKTININKTLTTKIKGQKWSIFPPKTKSSYRIIPITKDLLEDLKQLYNTYLNLDGGVSIDI